LFVKASEDEQPSPPIGRVVTADELFSVCRRIIEFLGLDPCDFSPNLIIRCQPVSFKKYKNTDDLDVLNSFFIRDVQRVANGVASGQCGQALAAYLQQPNANLASRVDLRKQSPLDLCWEKLQPDRYPEARWPSSGHHPLVYSQQIAVNELFSKLKGNAGLFGINGPPGTGKTTLLRDVVAGVIVERAKALAKLSQPEEAFISHENWKTAGFTRRINIFQDSISGPGMVVASANNGAVENVTLELPSSEAIDESWRANVDHFGKHASRLLNAPAWGLIAARLGNKANRREFLKRFWYDEDDDEGGSQDDGFLSYLKEIEGTPVNWSEAVRQFQTVVKSESKVRENRRKAWEAVIKFGQLKKQQRETTDQLSVLDQQRRDAEAAKEKASVAFGSCTSELENARNDRLRHHAFRPAWWMVLLTLGKAYRQWREPDLEYQRRIISAERSTADAQEALSAANERHAQIEEAYGERAQALAQVEAQLALVREEIDQARSVLGEHFPFSSDWANDEPQREKSSPWMDREWSLARAEVFFAALRLHHAFIHASANQVRQNLMALSDVLSGNLPGSVSSKAVKAAWDALFLLIPVISTTFASMDRLFPFHDSESLGWLFIDEAGQATPQAAIGAIWRARRAVVVGDPLQLEPILALPFTAQDSLRSYFGVTEYWRPGSLSCQRLADQASPLGTWVPTDDEPLWVGSPLRVHRRCDELMFKVSNHVAYHGLMIFGTAKRADLSCRPSMWFDVKRREASDSHWIPEEGDVARGLLDELTNDGLSPQDIFLISPFRTVVRELVQIGRQYEGLRAGTIHTVQGKEADIVILVLGGNPKKGGAKDWAASKPNPVNVAASRARRRLYVVGDREEWRKRKYFSTLSVVLGGQ
ncbi:MAG: AAA domain-containing protein, partial [Terrimicrobiaceae bacterium]